MKSIKIKLTPVTQRSLLCLCLSSAMLLTPAISNTAFAESSTQQIKQFNISKGPLGAALNRFAQQAGIAISFNADQVKGLSTSGIQGGFSVNEGFIQLLKGSGLSVAATASGYIIRENGIQDSIVLDPMQVTGAAIRGNTTEGTGSYTTGSMSSATGLNLSIRETPQTVTVVTQQKIEDQGASNLYDVIDRVAGISTDTRSYGAEPTVSSRGFTTTGDIRVDGEVQLGVSSNFGNQNLADIAIYDRVEVLRGSAGLLQGQGSPSVSINLARKRPTKDFTGFVQLSGGRWDARRGVVDLSSPLAAQGKIRGRVVAAYDSNDSYINFLEKENSTLYGIIEADLTESTLLTVGTQYQKHNVDGLNYGSSVPLFYTDGAYTDFSRSVSVGFGGAYNDVDKTTVFGSVEHEFLNEWVIKVSGTTTDSDQSILMSFVNGWVDRDTGNLSPFSSFSASWASHFKNDNINVSASGPFSLFGRTHQINIGWDQSKIDRKQSNYTELFVNTPGSFYNWDYTGPVYSKDTSINVLIGRKQSGFYASGQFSLVDSLTMIAGARLSRYYTHQVALLPGGFELFSNYSSDNNILTPYLGFVYDLTENVSAYVSYTDIFNVQSNLDRNSSLLDPVIGANYEVGLKMELFDSRFNASIALFRIEQKNLAELDTYEDGSTVIIDGSSRYVAQGKIISKGIEIDATGEILPSLQIQAGFSYHEAEDDNGANYLTQNPKTQLKLYTSYQFSGPLNGLNVGGGARWQGKIKNKEIGPNGEGYVQDNYMVADLFARYGVTSNLDLMLNIDNIFDKKYFRGIQQYGAYGEPRNIMVTLKAKF